MTTPPTPPSDVPLDEAVLHIGLGKAGTTSIQHFLMKNRARLADLGLLVPISPGRHRHVDLGFFVRSQAELDQTVEWQRRGGSSLPAFRRRFRRRLLREISRSGLPRALFTDEDLFSSTERAVARARRLTDRLARQVRVVAYLRRQDDHMVSRYQQAVRIGETARLDEYAARDWAWKYDYHRQLETWRQILDPARFVVRRYEPGQFAGGSLFQDFLDAIGVEASADDFEEVGTYNDGLDAETVEFIRLHNLFRVQHEGATPYLIDNRQLTKRLRAVSAGGPSLTLPDDVLDRFMERWTTSNRAVARQILGEEDELFRTPRKSHGTTTDQRIDPGRLDHYLAALKVPLETQSSMRQIAAQSGPS